MNKKWVLLCLAAGMFCMSGCGEKVTKPEETQNDLSVQSTEKPETSTTASTETEEESYEEIVATFQAATLKEATDKMEAGDEFYLYIGRENCPACKKFVPIFKKIKEEKNLTVFYVDENLKDPGFPEFIEKYKLEFIPVLMRASEKKLEKLDYGEKITEESVRALFP